MSGEAAVYPSLEALVQALYGPAVSVVGRLPIGGGDINDAQKLTLSNGQALFAKSNASANFGFFTAEAAGLAAIAQTGAIATPRVLGLVNDPKTRKACLVLPFLVQGPRAGDYWQTLGHRLAAMHRAPTNGLVPGGSFGFAADNFIGYTRQINTPAQTWVQFFAQSRLLPQIQLAKASLDSELLDCLFSIADRLDKWMPEPEQPSLVHGDLWAGNVMPGPDGAAWLIDPAAYVGSAEADLAMTALFGGFPPAFYDAYREGNPIAPGFAQRKDLYNLYHLLNHFNMFGSSYYYDVQEIAHRYA